MSDELIHKRTAKNNESTKILRFRKSERLLHWSLAVPFLVCFTTAVILIIFYNPSPTRPYRLWFSWGHRISGILLLILPLFSISKGRHDWRLHFYNIKQAWVWTFEDIKWLMLMGIATIFKKIRLPEQSKFNAAEKLNFMYLMVTYPFYIMTGALIWFTDVAFVSWLLHCYMAMLATPFILGHIFMATINPDTRVGLHGMFSGHVDRHWAKHHYPRWYREHFEQRLGSETEK